MSLTAKQARFVEEYLIDLNATQAAIRAGYSARTAKSQGQRLLTNVDVERALTEAQAARSQRTQIKADWVLSRLADEAVADLADIYTADGQLRPIHEWPLIWRQGLITGVDVEEMRVDGEAVGHIRKVKISDRIKRIELIGKHVDVQAFREQVEQTGAITFTVTQDDAEL
ncbi:terminase small subunit [Ponticoccus litoralis]|uniref:Terminase small subunit n=1 Tax=Ponticoccus litoralis TaxID=422297 RepID=A0AAW9SJC3_9RHOB